MNVSFNEQNRGIYLGQPIIVLAVVSLHNAMPITISLRMALQ
jgi:hypothetical protein